LIASLELARDAQADLEQNETFGRITVRSLALACGAMKDQATVV
jgi:chromatin segregation and condensation protein Rec8/ScpA/Scc1 (kleisin family)